jgi:ankyrin repeat protein
MLDAKTVDVNVANESGNTALMEAAQRDAHELLQLLMSRGAAVDAVNAQGVTALHKAVSRPVDANGSASRCVPLLLAAGANAALADKHGESALAKAVRQQRIADVRLLLSAYEKSKDALARLRNKSGLTPLQR